MVGSIFSAIERVVAAIGLGCEAFSAIEDIVDTVAAAGVFEAIVTSLRAAPCRGVKRAVRVHPVSGEYLIGRTLFRRFAKIHVSDEE